MLNKLLSMLYGSKKSKTTEENVTEVAESYNGGEPIYVQLDYSQLDPNLISPPPLGNIVEGG